MMIPDDAMVIEKAGDMAKHDLIKPEVYDSINKPLHYNSHPSGIEVIDITRHESFNIGNAVKYLLRHQYKNGLEDLRKSIWSVLDEIGRLHKLDVQPAKDAVKQALDNAMLVQAAPGIIAKLEAENNAS